MSWSMTAVNQVDDNGIITLNSYVTASPTNADLCPFANFKNVQRVECETSNIWVTLTATIMWIIIYYLQMEII